MCITLASPIPISYDVSYSNGRIRIDILYKRQLISKSLWSINCKFEFSRDVHGNVVSCTVSHSSGNYSTFGCDDELCTQIRNIIGDGGMA